MANRIDEGGWVPVYRPPVKKAAAPKPKATTSSSSTKSGGAPSGGGGKPKDPYAAAQRRAERKERQAKNAAAQRYIQQAESMAGQIRALKNSLGAHGFQAALNRRLANISLVSAQQDAALVTSHAERVKSLAEGSKDNEQAAADSTFQNLGNKARERTNAIQEALAQGAGESDVMKSQLMSLRNWDSNQNEINRSFFDSLRSTNASLTDLNVDTRTARINMADQANADRDQVWTNYYDQRSETLVQLGNLYGQQGELFGMANEQRKSKGTQKRRKAAIGASNQQFMAASRANAQVWDNPGVPAALTNWKGDAAFEGELSNNRVEQAAKLTEVKRPEGATLRKWTT